MDWCWNYLDRASDRGCARAFNGSNLCHFRQLPTGIVAGRACRLIKVKAEMLDLGRRHRLPMCGEHFSEVLREDINMLLEEEKGSTDGTQLPFVNDKGELLHRVGSTSQLIRLGYLCGCGGMKAASGGGGLINTHPDLMTGLPLQIVHLLPAHL
jgi:hypothetical protein